MPRWMEFSRNYDYRWPSRAVTAYKQGQKVYVKDDVADAAEADGSAKEIAKPSRSDASRVVGSEYSEGEPDETGNSDNQSAVAESIHIQSGGDAPGGEEIDAEANLEEDS